MKTGIKGTGYYVPEKILKNSDLEKTVETTDEWITTRTGIRERRIAAPGEHMTDMAVKAAEMAIKNSGLDRSKISLVITATITPDNPWPSAATLIQKKLGLKNTPAFDMSAACSGFIYGLDMAKAMVEAGGYENVLLIAAEKMSSITDWQDRGTCILLGDGAGAVIVGKVESGGILSTVLYADGSGREMLVQPAGGSDLPATEETVKNRLHYLKMNGTEVYKHAIEKMPKALQAAMDKAGIKAPDLDFVIFHQANLRIIESIIKKFGWPEEKNIVNIQKYGNTSAATIPIALAEAIETGRIKKGSIVGMSTLGAGFTWAGAVVTI